MITFTHTLSSRLSSQKSCSMGSSHVDDGSSDFGGFGIGGNERGREVLGGIAEGREAACMG